MTLESSYVPEIIPDEDLAYFEKAGYGNRIDWGEHPAVLVVDMTEEFTSDEYAVGRTDTGSAAVEANRRLIKAARGIGVPVYYVKPGRGFPDGYPGSTKRPGAVHDASKSRKGNVIHPDLAPEPGEVVIEKPRASAFFDTHLALLLHERGIDTLLVTGMTTSGCVRASVVDAHSSNFRTIIPAECTADRSSFAHEASLFDLDMKYADVTPLAEVLDRLEATAVASADD